MERWETQTPAVRPPGRSRSTTPRARGLSHNDGRHPMINLANPEIWLVCGSQHLYGPGPLQKVAADARDIAGALDDSPKLPLKVVFKALLTTPDEIAKLCLEANADENCAGLILWMHTFSPAKMWIRGLNVAAEAVPPSPHAVQPRAAVVDDRHGLHEPEPVGARRPRGRVHPHPDAARAQGRRRPLVRPGGPRAHRRLDARRPRLGRLAGRAVLPLRRQHAPGRGDRGRQGRGGNEVRLLRPTPTGSATWSRSVDGVSDAEARRARRRVRGALRRRARAAPGRRRHESLVYGARLELGLRAFLGKGGFKGFTTTFEDLDGLKQLPGPRAPAPDGRRLRLRRRGRLEDRGAASAP